MRNPPPSNVYVLATAARDPDAERRRQRRGVAALVTVFIAILVFTTIVLLWPIPDGQAHTLTAIAALSGL